MMVHEARGTLAQCHYVFNNGARCSNAWESPFRLCEVHNLTIVSGGKKDTNQDSGQSLVVRRRRSIVL